MSNTLGKQTLTVKIKAIAISATLLLTGCVAQRNDSTASIDNETEITQVDESPIRDPNADQAPANTPTLRPSLDELRANKELPADLGALLSNEIVRVDINGAQCTGMIINGYLISAAHCVFNEETEEQTPYIDYTFWQDDFSQIRGSASLWTWNNSNLDVLVAELDPSSDYSHSWHVPYFANENAEIGTPFAIASHALGTNPPLIAHLTYIGGDANQNVFAVDADNSLDALVNVCQPGASGSMITDGYGHISVLSAVHRKYLPDGTQNPEWTEIQKITEDNYNVDLTGVNLICYASPVTRDTIDALIHSLDSYEPEPSVLKVDSSLGLDTSFN